jgi:hypothetical protein
MPIRVTPANVQRIAASLGAQFFEQEARREFVCGAQVLEILLDGTDRGSRTPPAIICWMSGDRESVKGVRHLRLAAIADNDLPTAECVMADSRKAPKSRHPHPIHRRAIPVRR